MVWGFCVYFVYMIPLETDVLRKHRFQKPGLYPVPYNHSNIYYDMTPLSATVFRVSTDVGGWGSGYKCISLSQRVLVYACAK